MRARWVPIVAVVALAGCSTSTKASSTTTAPAVTTAPAAAPTTAAPVTAAPVITLKVSGSPTGSVTILDGSQTTQHEGQALPWTGTITDDPPDVGLTAQSGSGSGTATITCEIDIPGAQPVKNTSSGAYAVVTCTANPGI